MENFKRTLKNNMIYVILGLLILAMIAIVIVASISSSKNQSLTVPPTVTDDPAQSTTPPVETPPSEEDVQGKPTLRFVLPLAGTVVKTHDDSLLVMSETMKDYRVHLGLDIEAGIGTAVVACANGTISRLYTDPFMGVSIEIDHGDGLTSIYQNLSETTGEGIAEGVAVKAGDIIGAVGETARLEIAQAPHLHFEMKQNEVSIDPLDHIPYSADVNTGTNYEDE